MDKEIYHIVTESDFKKNSNGTEYTPSSLKTEGFIHCTKGKELSLVVAEDYFSGVTEPLLLLKINEEKCRSEVRFENASPGKGGKEHLRFERIFPHIHGPLNLDAVKGTGRMTRKEGRFCWPEVFTAEDLY